VLCLINTEQVARVVGFAELPVAEYIQVMRQLWTVV